MNSTHEHIRRMLAPYTPIAAQLRDLERRLTDGTANDEDAAEAAALIGDLGALTVRTTAWMRRLRQALERLP